MNEHQWRTTTDFRAMLAQVRPQASDRQLRLLAIGFARLQWADLSPEGRRVVELAERYTDDPGAWGALTEAVRALGQPAPPGRRRSERVGAEAAARRCAAGDPSGGIPDFDYLSEAFARALCDLVRELFGNPFRPSRLDPSWLTFQGGLVRRLVRDVYHGRAWGEMHVLADALEDAGCTDEHLLGHLRGGGPHALGCWAVDLLTEGMGVATATPEERELPWIARPVAAWSVSFTAPDSSARPPLEPADLAHRLDSPVEGGREAILAAAWSPGTWGNSQEVHSIRRVWLFVASDWLPLPRRHRGRPLATPQGTMLVYEEGEEEAAWQDLAKSCPAVAVLLPLRRSGPMAGRRLVARILAGEEDLLPHLAELLEGAGSPRAGAVRHLVGPVQAPAPVEPVTVTADAELEKARAEEATRPCPGCGAVKDRRVLRVQKEGPNTGRLFVKCFGCQRFDWLGGKPAKVVEDDPELDRLRGEQRLCYADCGPVEVGRVRKPGRNQGRLYTRCPRCGAFCWQR